MQYMNPALIRTALRFTFKPISKIALPVIGFRRVLALSSILFKAHVQAAMTRSDLNGVAGIRVQSLIHQRGLNNKVVLHLHGGAFFAGSARSHRAFGSEIAVRSHAIVHLIDYRLAPEHPYPAALEDGLVAYQALLSRGYQPHQIIIGGDSAGGNLALALCLAIRDRLGHVPSGLYLISPFLDLTLAGSSMTSQHQSDPMLTIEVLQRGRAFYRGDLSLDDARISPLFADLRGLCPMLIQVGTDEILRDDSTQLAARAKEAGVSVDCQVYDGMWHDFQLFNNYVQDANTALDKIARFIKTCSGEVGQSALRVVERAI